ncbi:MAG: proline dehydrogenase [Gemmatimonas sp.]|nr:proline dehydrogenase [Gemmatimonas sp.]
MLRQSLLYLSDNQTLRRTVSEARLSRRLVDRFVAGETLDEAIAVSRLLNESGLPVSLDHLGEAVITKEEALSACDMAIRSVERIAVDGIDANISVKVTQLGLDIEEDFCLANLERILRRANELATDDGEIFVRLDMESTDYTEKTIQLVEALWGRGFRNVGTVLQSYLRRTPGDVKRLNALGSRVRLVKGAYNESEKIAFPDKFDVDDMFVEEMKLLLTDGVYPAIATHDEQMISATRRFAFEQGIPRDSFEFQMLYGVRRDLQQRLREEGYKVRIYVPYGVSWYPYLMRRMAERPANLLFLATSVAKESPLGRAARPVAVGLGVVAGALAASAWRGRNSK